MVPVMLNLKFAYAAISTNHSHPHQMNGYVILLLFCCFTLILFFVVVDFDLLLIFLLSWVLVPMGGIPGAIPLEINK